MKKFLSTALLIVMIAALMIFAAGCDSNSTDAEDRIAQLEQENAELKAQVEALTAQLGNEAARLEQVLSMKDWNLNAAPWSDGNGATVTFTATPDSYAEGMRAALSVRMGDLEAESTNCVWDGNAFTGSVDLGAADGYSYYCVLTAPDGSQQEIALNTPDAVTDEMLVYLGSSLSAYANLIVEDWEATDSSLVVKTGYIQVQLPRMAASGTSASISAVDLILNLNGSEVSRQAVTLEAGEGEGSFESEISSCTFTMPALEEDYQLDLWLEVTLSTGNTISVNGGSWYYNSGALQLVVG